MCNLYSITTNQAAIIALFRVINRYVGNLPPMPGVFPDYPAAVIRNADAGTEMVTMRWGMPPPPRTGVVPVTNIRIGLAEECGSVPVKDRLRLHGSTDQQDQHPNRRRRLLDWTAV
jgi:putative SOS response-associated peptidase YedK